MKTLKLFSALMIVVALLCVVNNVSAQQMARENVVSYVVNAINYPPSALGENLQGDVRVSFTTDGHNRLRVLEINGAPELRSYVYEQISGLILPGAVSGMEEPIALRFNFRLI